MKGLYLRFKRMFSLLFSKEYILIVNKDDNRFDILHNLHCVSCATNLLEESYSVMCEVEEDEIDQNNAIDLTNRILKNRN